MGEPRGVAGARNLAANGRLRRQDPRHDRRPHRLSAAAWVSEKAARTSPALLTLDADDLPQRVDDFDEVSLRGHDGVDVLVSAGCLIEDAFVLAALDMRGRASVIR